MTRSAAVIAALGLVAATAIVSFAMAQMGDPIIDGARGLYLLRCAGCHGIQGVSVPKSIPTLRGRVGVFLCSAAGREFMLRLPNIQMSLIRSDKDLADVMNFVAFDLGGASTPRGARPFTAPEVAKTRGRPLDTRTLSIQHEALLQRAGSCASVYWAQTNGRFDGPY